MSRLFCRVLFVLGAFTWSAVWGQSTDYPTRPARIIVASTAGGPIDLMARMAGGWWQQRLGQPFIVEARPGGNTMIATEAVVKSPPDGYTLLATSQAVGSQAYFFKNPPYHPLRDITPVAILQSSGLFYAVPVRHPAKTIAELVAWVKANPGKLNYGEAGLTSLGLEDLFARLGMEVTRVPYKGGAPMLAALLSGEIDFGLVNAGDSKANESKMRTLAYTDVKRHPARPEIPTVSETVLPGFKDLLWLGIVGPGGIPPAIANKLNAEIAELLKTPDAIASIRAQGREPMTVDVAGMRREIEAVMKLTEPLVARGIVVPQ